VGKALFLQHELMRTGWLWLLGALAHAELVAEWASVFSGPNPFVVQTAVDGAGRTYLSANWGQAGGATLAGQHMNVLPAGQGAGILRCNSTGDLEWSVLLSPTVGAVYVRALTVTLAGEALAVGIFTGAMTAGGASVAAAGSSMETWAIKLNASGAVAWLVSLGADVLLASGSNALAADPEGNGYVAGYFGGAGATVGNLMGNVTLSGTVNGGSVYGQTTGMVAQLHAAHGGIGWATAFPSDDPAGGSSTCGAVAVFAEGTYELPGDWSGLYVAGTFERRIQPPGSAALTAHADGRVLFLSMLNMQAQGVDFWTAALTNTTCSGNACPGVGALAVDATGLEVTVVGTFMGTVQVGTQIGSPGGRELVIVGGPSPNDISSFVIHTNSSHLFDTPEVAWADAVENSVYPLVALDAYERPLVAFAVKPPGDDDNGMPLPLFQLGGASSPPPPALAAVYALGMATLDQADGAMVWSAAYGDHVVTIPKGLATAPHKDQRLGATIIGSFMADFTFACKVCRLSPPTERPASPTVAPRAPSRHPLASH
jgi:hypothetical protein